MENLWGEFNIENISTPKSILDEQAKYLPKMTKNSVYAVVTYEEKMNIKETEEKKLKDFNYTFYIKSKYIDTYSYRAFSIHHNIDIYPLNMKIDRSLKSDISDKLAKENIVNEGLLAILPDDYIEIMDEEVFKKTIGIILSSQKMKYIISSLVSLSKQSCF
jgi:hypothetical protein